MFDGVQTRTGAYKAWCCELAQSSDDSDDEDSDDEDSDEEESPQDEGPIDNGTLLLCFNR